ncbi:vitamin B12 dependent-methionine synthase activation domain-containing protein [Paenibacillus sp. NPDC058071]|uniref:vitamin B12 dependent-methionine synthase activation domain-containing protein n=1 Tax=Paenibacillus sp. NPDC058071 TaxID=3346326 RepID=UPI0036DC2564
MNMEIELEKIKTLGKPVDYEPHVFRNYPIDYLYPYVNMQTLIGYHMGLGSKLADRLREGDEKAVMLQELIDGLYAEAKRDGIIQANGMFRFFPAQSSGDEVLVYDPAEEGKVLQRFSFPRQQEAPHRCIADYIRPVGSGEMDSIGFCIVTAGIGVRELAEEWKEKGDYLRCHALQAIAIETAEAFMERIHHMMRDFCGYPDAMEMTMQDRFAAKYKGQRFSFGYPACPNLDGQQQLYALLQPADIGIEITEGCMLDPEASVAAFVVSHPDARYFAI